MYIVLYIARMTGESGNACGQHLCIGLNGAADIRTIFHSTNRNSTAV